MERHFYISKSLKCCSFSLCPSSCPPGKSLLILPGWTQTPLPPWSHHTPLRSECPPLSALTVLWGSGLRNSYGLSLVSVLWTVGPLQVETLWFVLQRLARSLKACEFNSLEAWYNSHPGLVVELPSALNCFEWTASSAPSSRFMISSNNLKDTAAFGLFSCVAGVKRWLFYVKRINSFLDSHS